MPAPPGLHGFDVGRLRLEAKFSYYKRIRKIVTVFPQTWEYLKDKQDPLFRGFVDACPPFTIGRLDNANQFYDFLCETWTREPPEPVYLPDIAACELAFARVRSHVSGPDAGYEGPGRTIRRRPGVETVTCNYNVIPLFGEENADGEPVRKMTCLAILLSGKSGHPRVFEVPEQVIGILSRLDDWVPLAAIAGNPIARAMLTEFAEAGLIEVSP